jgi:hypothetical protein
MSPLLLVIVVVAIVAALRAEPEPAEFNPELLEASECRGEPRPVGEETLVSTLARFGFELEREDLCDGTGIEPSAMFANITTENWEAPESDVIFASDGQVWCDLYRSNRFGREVDRRRVEDEVVFQTFNVECRIYESDAWQIERLDDAVHQLARAG